MASVPPSPPPPPSAPQARPADTPDAPAGAGPSGDAAPGDETTSDFAGGVRSYCIGLAVAAALTGMSFWALHTHLIWGPGIPMALATLAVAQMGVHLVFFLHITTGPDNTNNIMALAFGLLIVLLLVGGSLWIMAHLNHNMVMPAPDLNAGP